METTLEKWLRELVAETGDSGIVSAKVVATDDKVQLRLGSPARRLTFIVRGNTAFVQPSEKQP